MKRIAVIILCAALCSINAWGAATNSVSQYGITWTFSQAHEVGQYANGDYWVLGPVTITSMTPAFDGTQNGWQANPATPGQQGLDAQGQAFSTFNAALVPQLPYVAQPGVSIVKAISIPGGGRPCLKTAAVLTVVGTIPPDNGATIFRPPYFGTEKPNYSINSLNLALLPQRAATAGIRTYAPTLSTYVGAFQRVQIDWISDSPGQFIRPTDNMPSYGSEIAKRNAEAALRFMVDIETADLKKPALINYVQYGIDIYHAVKCGQAWWGSGGHDLGRKLPLALAAVLLNNQAMKNAVLNSSSGVFQENHEVVFSAKADNGRGKALWGQLTCTKLQYWKVIPYDDAGGSKTCPDPYGYIDGGFTPGAGYDYCCVTMPGKGTALAVRLMPELDAIWNHREFLDWIDTRISFGAWTQPDPCAPYDGAGRVGETVDMSKYGITFGPDPARPGDCIRDNNPTDGIGRFPALHGTKKNEGTYGSNFVSFMWNAFRKPLLPVADEYRGPKTENRPELMQVVFHPLSGALRVPRAGVLRVYDCRGRVALQAEPRQAGLVDARGLAAGIYGYQLRTGDAAVTGKMVILK